MWAANSIKIGAYNGKDLIIKRSLLPYVAGKVVYFRAFGNMYVYAGYGNEINSHDYDVNCPVHPDFKKVYECDSQENQK